MKKEHAYFYFLLNQLRLQTKCIDKQVACIITDNKYNILSSGVNTIINCNKNCHDKEKRICNVRHAEVVACNNLNMVRYGVHAYKIAFVNLFPCVPCQNYLKVHGVKQIVTYGIKHKEQVFDNIVIEKDLDKEWINNNLSDTYVTCMADVVDLLMDCHIYLKLLWEKNPELYNEFREALIDFYLQAANIN